MQNLSLHCLWKFSNNFSILSLLHLFVSYLPEQACTTVAPVSLKSPLSIILVFIIDTYFMLTNIHHKCTFDFLLLGCERESVQGDTNTI